MEGEEVEAWAHGVMGFQPHIPLAAPCAVRALASSTICVSTEWGSTRGLEIPACRNTNLNGWVVSSRSMQISGAVIDKVTFAHDLGMEFFFRANGKEG